MQFTTEIKELLTAGTKLKTKTSLTTHILIVIAGQEQVLLITLTRYNKGYNPLRCPFSYVSDILHTMSAPRKLNTCPECSS